MISLSLGLSSVEGEDGRPSKNLTVEGRGKAFLSFTVLTFIKFQRSLGWTLQEKLIRSILEAFIYNKDN